MKKTTLKNYAKLLAVSGISVKKNDVVIINAGLDQPEFVYMCVEACYKALKADYSNATETRDVEKLLGSLQ